MTMAEDESDSGIKLSRQIIAIKAAAVVVGLMILIIAIAAGWSGVSSENEESSLEAALTEFLNDLAVYDGINAYNEPLVNHFDVVKLKTITSETIRADLDPEYDFIIEIIDVSQYSESFSLNVESGTAVQTGSAGSFSTTVTEQRAAALVMGDETHAAVLKVTLMV